MTLRDQIDQIARLEEAATQGEATVEAAHGYWTLRVGGLFIASASLNPSSERTLQSIAALVNYYRSGALQRLADLASRWESFEKVPDFMEKGLQAVGEELTRLRELAEDGERYRWLKAHHLQIGPDSWIRTGSDLDDAIDSARAPSVKEESLNPKNEEGKS